MPPCQLQPIAVCYITQIERAPSVQPQNSEPHEFIRRWRRKNNLNILYERPVNSYSQYTPKRHMLTCGEVDRYRSLTKQETVDHLSTIPFF